MQKQLHIAGSITSIATHVADTGGCVRRGLGGLSLSLSLPIYLSLPLPPSLLSSLLPSLLPSILPLLLPSLLANYTLWTGTGLLV